MPVYEIDPRPKPAGRPTTIIPDNPIAAAQLAQRAAIARREAEVKKAITEAYPSGNQPVKFRMLATGQVLESGYQNAFRAIFERFAELVRPDGSTWKVE